MYIRTAQKNVLLIPFGGNANSPVVRNFIQSLPEGCKTTITVGGKQVVVDKTGKDTVVTPQDKESDDIRGDDLNLHPNLNHVRNRRTMNIKYSALA